MASTTAQRGTTLSVIQEVHRRQSYDVPATLTATRTSRLMLDLLNDVMAHISDQGDWPQLYEDVTVQAPACAQRVEVNASGPVKRIEELRVSGRRAPMVLTEKSTIRQLQQSSSRGTPQQWALMRTSGVNPILDIYPRVQTSGQMIAAAYVMPAIYTTANASAIPPWSSRLLVQGLQAAVMLDEAGGEQTPQVQAAFRIFQQQLGEELRRWTSDSGGPITFTIDRAR